MDVNAEQLRQMRDAHGITLEQVSRRLERQPPVERRRRREAPKEPRGEGMRERSE